MKILAFIFFAAFVLPRLSAILPENMLWIAFYIVAGSLVAASALKTVRGLFGALFS